MESRNKGLRLMPREPTLVISALRLGLLARPRRGGH